VRFGLRRVAPGLSVLVALVTFAACDAGGAPQAPPLGPPDSRSPGSGGACSEPDVPDASVVLFSSAGECRPGDVMVLYRCAPTAAPVLRLSSGRGSVEFLGGPFAVPVTALPANIRFVGAGDGVDVLVADPATSSSADPTSASPAPIADPETEPEPLVYVRRDSVTERWLRLPPRGVVHDQPAAWLIGDSILDGGRKEVEAALEGWSLTLDAEVGRPSSSGIPLAEAAADAGADVVLVELGTNDTSAAEFRGHLVETLDVLRGVPLVLWQTTRGPGDQPTIGEVSATIRDVVPRFPNASLADWESFVPEDAVQTDGIHPDIGSEGLESQLLSPLFSEWQDAVSGEGPTVCGSEVVRQTS
jgi:hypothetical protein